MRSRLNICIDYPRFVAVEAARAMRISLAPIRSLLGLFLAITFVCVLLAGVCYKVRSATLQRRAIASIRDSGGGVTSGSAVSVDLRGVAVNSRIIEALATLRAVDMLRIDQTAAPSLKRLAASVDIETLEISDVTDERCNDLRLLKNLRVLELSHSQVTTKGLELLHDVPALQTIWFVNSEITDDAIKAINRLQQIKNLSLAHTAVTDAGITCLRSHPSLEVLYIDNTCATDRCLSALAEITRLRRIGLRGTYVTRAGVLWLASRRPGLEIEW